MADNSTHGDILNRLHSWPLHEKEPLAITVVLNDAAEEIWRLRTAIAIAAGLISTLPQYEVWHPEQISDMLLEKADTQ